MGKSSQRRSQNASKESEEETDIFREDDSKVHPVENANWFSFATFFWMGRIMELANKHGLSDNDVPDIASKEKCKRNADLLEQLWAREMAFADAQSSSRPSFAKVAWLYCRGRVLITSVIYITSLLLGFLTPTVFMRKVMSFATKREISITEGLIWVGLLIICELGRVLFFTLTWAMNYRTAIRLKTASMGLVYRKLLRIGNLSDSVSSKLLNVISGDCNRLSEVLLSGQVAIGGPVVLVLSAGYIWFELGFLPLLGLLVFVFSYPLLYFMAKGSGSMKRKAARVKDERVSLISQVIQHFKFLKMFGWEKHLFETVSDVREKERKYIFKGQLLQSFGVVLGPALPHVAAILTFLIYISVGNKLVPEQAFLVIVIFSSRVRPTFMRSRAGFRAWFEAVVSVSRIQAFTTLFIFSLLFFSIRMLNSLYDCLYSYRICCERVKSLLVIAEAKDTNGNNFIANHASLDEAIVIQDLHLTRRKPFDADAATNALSKTEAKQRRKESKTINSIERLLGNGASERNSMSFQLGPLNLHVKKGSFVGICGYVGSGKTTLLETIAGSMTPDKGTLNTFGRTAYVPQHPWLFKGTIRDNITFGEPFDSVRYYSTIESCCLVNDFAVLPIGDLTKVDNNGTNLSGGQRQRISLARALYYPSGDIYLLDDPLSGLDNRVAKSIFENGIIGKLKQQKKTVVFVTHQLHFLKDCDEILVFSEGKIIQRGRHDELINIQDSIYHGLWATSNNCPNDNDQILLEDSDSQMLDIQQDTSAVITAKKLQLELEKSRKDIGAGVYQLYIKNAGGWIAFSLVMLAFFLSQGSTAFSSWWLKRWFKVGAPDGPLNGTSGSDVAVDIPSFPVDNLTRSDMEVEYISSQSENFAVNRDIYAGLISIIFVTSLFRTLLFVFASMKASKHIHRGILRHLFCNRMKTIEKIGTGQIFNLFARDIDEVDGSLPNNIENFLQNVFIVISILAVVSFIFPQFLVFAAILVFVFSFYRKIYNTAVRDLKRIETRRRSPILTRISETVKGLGTIRAFNKERLMIDQF